ncbi:MAG: phosphodiester glycosidase family protein [Ruminococcaceae bacterium]|nr:phosphodiester glycosidase family protein [Oscillospiraceae bacterium]
MRNLKSFVKILFTAIVSFVVLSIFAFYILIVWGASPKLQTMWVCTAMKTMNHKYLATLFIPEDTIEKILEENAVDDSEYNSTREELDVHEKENAENQVDLYVSEGYTELENGIYLKEVSGSTWKGYVMLVSDPLRVKLVDTAYQFEKGQTVKSMVTHSDAIAGINGGGFTDGINYDSNGGSPAGLIIEDGNLVFPVDKNSATEYNMIGINKKGVLVLRHCTAKWALENDIVSAVSFSPFIVVNGEGTVKNGSGGWGIAPRSAIGQRATGEFLFIVIDGRQVGWSIGCDLDVLQKVLLDEKAENGAMLDGGSSTVLFYNGDYVNRPSLGHERLINNCFIVTKISE